MIIATRRMTIATARPIRTNNFVLDSLALRPQPFASAAVYNSERTWEATMKQAWVRFLAITVSIVPITAFGVPATVLVKGMALERTLGPTEEQVYTVELQSGTAIIG